MNRKKPQPLFYTNARNPSISLQIQKGQKTVPKVVRPSPPPAPPVAKNKTE